jgi:hypothetical protein
MALEIVGFVGPQTQNDGNSARPYIGRSGEQIASELHGRFYEQTFRGNLYSVGSAAVVPLSANTITLTATTTPILGLWNPTTSGKNAVILQATLADFINNVTSVALGAFVWAVSTGNAVITTGLTPFSRKTLAQAGSVMKGFAGVTALTGLTNNLVVAEGAEFNTASGLLTTTVAAATPTPGVVGVANLDGSIIVPPGGVLALLNTVSTVTHSVWGRLLWEEVPA